MTENQEATPVARPKYDFYFVKLTHPKLQDQIVFRSLSEKRAMAFMERRYPRGSEAYLQSPDGTIRSYEHERTDEMGVEVEPWAEFDPATWAPVDQQAPPGENAWSDKEG